MSPPELRSSLRWLPPSLEPWGSAGSGRDVAVLMSGGVDSSVAALLLKEAGRKVLGVTMKVPVANGCTATRPCCGADAALVCRTLGVPHYFVDVVQPFEALVIAPFRRAYAEGRTPSPCVDCNAALKFGLVWDAIEERFGVRHVATGHYARVGSVAGQVRLARAADAAKDQSYFLYGVPARRLPFLLLPLGELAKAAVRALARKAGLPVAEKQESMELCFAGEGDYRHALEGEAGRRSGPILDTAGRVLGQHEGIAGFTLGQRRGLGIAAGKPLYVTAISLEANSVTVGSREDACWRRVRAGEANVLAPDRLAAGERLWGKVRSLGEPAPCTVLSLSDATLSVEFDEPQFAPAPGQRLVLYDAQGAIVAGGVIEADDNLARGPACCGTLTRPGVSPLRRGHELLII